MVDLEEIQKTLSKAKHVASSKDDPWAARYVKDIETLLTENRQLNTKAAIANTGTGFTHRDQKGGVCGWFRNGGHQSWLDEEANQLGTPPMIHLECEKCGLIVNFRLDGVGRLGHG